MVIDIPIESARSDTNVISSFLIEEEIESPKIQQLEQEPEIDPMARTRKRPAPVDGPATGPSNIPTLGSCLVLNLVQRLPNAVAPPIMELR